MPGDGSDPTQWNHANAVLEVSDVPRAIAYYRDGLGLVPGWMWEERVLRAEVNEDHRWGLGPEDNKLLDASELTERVTIARSVLCYIPYGTRRLIPRMQSLDGQVALVTGAARGIGFGIARVLAGEGAHVLIADIDAEAAQAAATQLGEDGLSAAATKMDVTDRDSVEAAVRGALERWKRIDVLAANAGIYPHIPLDEISGQDWDRLMTINVRGALFGIQACVPPMATQGYGRVVLTSSITGSVVGQPGYAHYGASKAAMLGLMRSSALEVAAHGITINAVLPGNIRTPGFADLGREHERRMAAAIPMREFGDPEDVGWAVRFLASKEAKYITGQTLIIDGGQVLPESVLELDPEPST